jgi:proteasome alpha subunit
LVLAAAALGQNETGHRDVPARDLEVAVLDRTRTQERKFRRLTAPVLVEILGDQGESAPPEELAGAPEEPTSDEATPESNEPPIAP